MGILKFLLSLKKNYVGQLRIIQGGHLKIRGTGKSSNMRGIQNFLWVRKNRGDKAFRGALTEGCLLGCSTVRFALPIFGLRDVAHSLDSWKLLFSSFKYPLWLNPLF